MSLSLSGINALAYQGTNVATPAPMYILNRAPTTDDNQNFNLGSFWLDKPNMVLYALVSLSGGVATWENISGGGAGISFVTDSGTALESGGIINLLGDSGNITTTASGNTIHVNFTSNPTISGNLNVTGNLTVHGTVTLSALNSAGVVQTNASGQLSTSNGTNGQILIGGGTAPTWANITSTGGSITITNGANSINLEAASGGSVINLPDTTSSSIGVLKINSVPYLHAYGGTANRNVWIGNGGNFTQTPGTAVDNIGIGNSALSGLTVGYQNVAIGTNAGAGTIGFFNCVYIGYNAAASVNGENNVCIGSNSGSTYTSNESNNICIRSIGVAGESFATHIGDQSGSVATSCFIGGISGIGVSAASSVLVKSNGQLGVAVSSIRFKDNIKSMGEQSKYLYDLRPVTFTYKEDPDKVKQYGLIAEEVHEVLPALVNYDNDNTPHSVRYHELPVMIINELQKLRDKVEVLEEALKNFTQF